MLDRKGGSLCCLGVLDPKTFFSINVIIEHDRALGHTDRESAPMRTQLARCKKATSPALCDLRPGTNVDNRKDSDIWLSLQACWQAIPSRRPRLTCDERIHSGDYDRSPLSSFALRPSGSNGVWC